MKLDATHSQFVVLRSVIGQAGHLCIWPAAEPYPMIYKFVFGPASRSSCEAFAAEHTDTLVFPGPKLRDPFRGLAEQLAPIFAYGAERLEQARETATTGVDPQGGVEPSKNVLAELDRLEATFRCLRVGTQSAVGGQAEAFIGRGGKWADSFIEHGTDAMVLGGSIAAAGALGTPLVPDGEVVGSALLLAGAASYGIGKILQYADL